VDAAASGACRGRRAGLSSVSERSAQTTGADIRMNLNAKPAAPGEASRRSRGRCVRQNRVVPAPVAGVKQAEERRPDRVRTILQSARDGGKMNSSPGRARHKPQNHCAGNVGCSPLPCMLVCASTLFCTRDRRCSAHPAFPAPSFFERCGNYCQTSGASRREIAESYSGGNHVIANS